MSVAIIGVGCIFPKAFGVKAFWRLLCHGHDAITDVPETHWSSEDYFHKDPKQPDHTYCTRGGFISPIAYDPSEFGIPPNCLEATDTSQLLGLTVAKMALEDAGYSGNKTFNREKTSVILGVTGTQELVIPLSSRLGHPLWRKALDEAGIDPRQAQEIINKISASYVPWQENSFPGLLGNVVSGRIANRLNLGGTNCVVDAACASSLSAVNLAILELQAGRSDMAITGGVDTLNDIFMHMCFSQTGVLSFTGDVRPFSEDADGTVLGEGIGMVVLKRLEDAKKDGDRIYCVIKSMGSSSDGRSGSIYAPDTKGQEKALRMAYENADVAPETVELVEAHGTGTRVGDAVEFKALKNVFQNSDKTGNRCALGSVKSNIGHAKAAAGAAGLIKAALAIHHKVIFPTLKVDRPDPNLNINNSPFYLCSKSKPWLKPKNHPRRSGVSAFGFGGSNFHTVLEENDNHKQSISWDSSVEILAFSAVTPKALQNELSTFKQLFEKDPADENQYDLEISLQAAASRQNFSFKNPYRLLLILEWQKNEKDRHTDLLKIISDASTAIEKKPELSWNKQGIYYGGPEKAKKLAFIFPGQGSQYTGMGRDLACVFPESQRCHENAEGIFAACSSSNGHLLNTFIYPPPPHLLDIKDAEEKLRDTKIAQPAIGAVSQSMLKILRDFGVHPDAVCGHSFGELTALCCAGWIDEDTFFSLSVKRGKFMSNTGRDKGTMLAVKAPLESLDSMIAENKLGVILANRNSHTQGVLSGSTSAINKAKTICEQKGFKSTLLPVSAAFHSELVKDAAMPFKDTLNSITITPSKIPVFSNTTAEPYPADPDKAKELLGKHLINPVNFVNEIENLYKSGVDTFVEIGPKAVLTGLVKSILKERDIHVSAMDNSSGRKSGIADLAKVLCHLASIGHPVDLCKWEDAPETKPAKKKMQIAISGANYRTDSKPKPKSESKPVRRQRSDKVIIEKINKVTESATPAAPRKNDKHVKLENRTTSNKKIGKKIMEPRTPVQAEFIVDALKVVQEGLKSMQDLQTQTAQAHNKFLEHQSEASRTMQLMMEKTQTMTQAVMGLPSSEVVISDYSAPTDRLSSDREPHQNISPESLPLLKTESPVESSPASPEPVHSATKDEEIAKIEKSMLEVVSELTGYPVEMLYMEMDIEADLGIDSIKRVEILSAFEEKMPGLASVSPDIMGEMKTLGQITDYLTSSLSEDIPESQALPHETVQMKSAPKEIEQNLLDIVSELTGYPIDMLDMEMDIEADLGIDSIKRVEILSAFEEKMPGLASVSPDIMGEMKTLGQINDYLAGTLQSSAPPLTSAPSGRNTAIDAAAPSQIKDNLLKIVGELTGYPIDMLDMEMDIEADLGIDSIKRVEILSAFEEKMPDLPSLSPEILGDMKTLGQIAEHLLHTIQSEEPEIEKKQPSNKHLQTDSKIAQKKEPVESVERNIVSLVEIPFNPGKKVIIPDGKVVFILGNETGIGKSISQELKSEGVTTQLIGPDVSEDTLSRSGGLIIAPETEDSETYEFFNDNDEAFLSHAFSVTHRIAPFLIESAKKGGALFASITRLDGCFGFKGGGVSHPVLGGLAGLVKTAAIEWEHVCCHAIDVAPGWKGNKALAKAVVTELLNFDPSGSIEIGFDVKNDTLYRSIPELKLTQFAQKGEISIAENDCVVITGGARGVTAECAIAMAKQLHPTIVLLGRSPAPEPEPDWLKSLNDEPVIKKAILEHAFSEKPVTPMKVEAVFRKYMAQREITQTLEKINATGANGLYFPVDIRNKEAVDHILSSVREDYGEIKAIIHGAGVLEDRFIKDKTKEMFDTVFTTKVMGLKALLQATKQDNLKYILLFSSVSARMGNKGQADYSMANEVLNKIAQQASATRKTCRVVSINWGPWDGGMVTASLKKEFARNNIDLIPIETGAMCMLSEMKGDSPYPAEVVIGAGLNQKLKPQNTPQVSGNRKPDLKKKNGLTVSFKSAVTVDTYPILKSHMLNGVPVVPFALMTEWFGHGALHENPGMYLHGIDDMRLLAGIKLDAGERMIHLLAGKAKKNGNIFEVDVEIRNGNKDSLGMLHSKAKAILTDQISPPPEFTKLSEIGSKAYSKSVHDAYDNILFHGANLQGIKRVIGYSSKGIVAEMICAPEPEKWISNPFRSRWLGDPLVLDCAFQMAILWCYEETGNVSLPSYAASYRQYRPEFPTEGITTALEVKAVSDYKMEGDFTFLDANQEVVARITGYEAVMDASLMKAFKPDKIMQASPSHS